MNRSVFVRACLAATGFLTAPFADQQYDKSQVQKDERTTNAFVLFRLTNTVFHHSVRCPAFVGSPLNKRVDNKPEDNKFNQMNM